MFLCHPAPQRKGGRLTDDVVLSMPDPSGTMSLESLLREGDTRLYLMVTLKCSSSKRGVPHPSNDPMFEDGVPTDWKCVLPPHGIGQHHIFNTTYFTPTTHNPTFFVWPGNNWDIWHGGDASQNCPFGAMLKVPSEAAVVSKRDRTPPQRDTTTKQAQKTPTRSPQTKKTKANKQPTPKRMMHTRLSYCNIHTLRCHTNSWCSHTHTPIITTGCYTVHVLRKAWT